MVKANKITYLFCSIFLTVVLSCAILVWSQAQDASQSTSKELLGGQGSIFNTTPNAFAQPMPGLEGMDEMLFFVGNSFFNQNWVTAPASTKARDGLGPLFNTRSCAGCHFKDGRGRAPEADETGTGFLIRLRIPERGEHGDFLPDPKYGGQFQDLGLEGVPAEGKIRIEYEEVSGEYPDGSSYSLRKPTYQFEELAYGDLHPEVVLSPRVANQMIGLGLLEAISEEDILGLADPEDKNGDGISGKPNYVWDAINERKALGRFGWRAEQPSVLQQVAGAFLGDIGITTDIFPEQDCAPGQDACLAATNGNNATSGFEIDADDLRKVELYSSTLAVPAQRNFGSSNVIKGENLFTDIGCQGCHVSEYTTGTHPNIPALSNQQIRPFTDLLLHDMGEGLADELGNFEASGSEWRTPPLWGIGLFETVNKHTFYLHDGRARNLEEAILWHGGEAEASKEKFMELKKSDRKMLIEFLSSL